MSAIRTAQVHGRRRGGEMMRVKKRKANKGDGAPPPQKKKSHNDLPLFLTPPVGPVSGYKNPQKRSPRPASFKNHDSGRPEHRNAYIRNIYLFLQFFTYLTV